MRCESIVLQSDWVLVVMDQFTRRLVGFGVHRGPVDAPSLCRMCNAAIHGRGAPRHLSTDHDPLFEAYRWTANLRLLEIDEIKTVPHVPLSHPFVERLIGTMRREFLDHVLFWNAGDLERKLADFQAYHNAARSACDWPSAIRHARSVRGSTTSHHAIGAGRCEARGWGWPYFSQPILEGDRSLFSPVLSPPVPRQRTQSANSLGKWRARQDSNLRPSA